MSHHFQSLAPIAAQTRRDQVAATLRQAIISGQIAPGTQLVESRLTAQLGVSRGLLREAVRELVEAGLVTNRPYAGAFVAEMNAQMLLDVYEMRRALEIQAYTRIWPKRDRAFRNELQQRFARMLEAIQRDELTEKIRTEADFHGLVFEMCGNHLMPTFWQQMSQKIQLGFAICQISLAPKPDFETNHQRFLDCALGASLCEMIDELNTHLDRGLATIQISAG